MLSSSLFFRVNINKNLFFSSGVADVVLFLLLFGAMVAVNGLPFHGAMIGVARATTARRPWYWQLPYCGGVDCSLARSICISLSVIIVSLVRNLRKNKHTLNKSASRLGVPIAAVVAADVSCMWWCHLMLPVPAVSFSLSSVVVEVGVEVVWCC